MLVGCIYTSNYFFPFGNIFVVAAKKMVNGSIWWITHRIVCYNFILQPSITSLSCIYVMFNSWKIPKVVPKTAQKNVLFTDVVDLYCSVICIVFWTPIQEICAHKIYIIPKLNKGSSMNAYYHNLIKTVSLLVLLVLSAKVSITSYVVRQNLQSNLLHYLYYYNTSTQY